MGYVPCMPPKTPISAADLAPEVGEALTTQAYGGGTRIEGVTLVPLTTHADDGGAFVEVARLAEGGMLEGIDGVAVRQINWSVLEPGAVKAWHLHFNQEDVWFVPPGSRLICGLRDCREDSPTKGATMRFVMGVGAPKLVLIPRGVAHGVANLTGEAGTLIYLVNQQFDAANPDERRLPWDAFGEDFWDMTLG